MILEFLGQAWVLTTVCLLSVFVSMFVAKYAFLVFTKKIPNAVAKRSVNMLLGVVESVGLAAGIMWIECDIWSGTYSWILVVAAGLGATLLYLILEKIFGETELVEYGKKFIGFASKVFGDDLKNKGANALSEKLDNIAHDITDNAKKEENAKVNAVVEKLNVFCADGKISDEERNEAEKLIKENAEALAGNSVLEKYRKLLGK